MTDTHRTPKVGGGSFFQTFSKQGHDVTVPLGIAARKMFRDVFKASAAN